MGGGATTDDAELCFDGLEVGHGGGCGGGSGGGGGGASKTGGEVADFGEEVVPVVVRATSH